MAKLNVKKGDLVKLISGSKLERGKTGVVLEVFPETQRVIVEGINLVTRHVRESQTADGRRVEGGRQTTEAPVHVSNVQLVVKDGKNEVVTRVGHERVEVTKTRADGSTYTGTRSKRIARKTGKEI